MQFNVRHLLYLVSLVALQLVLRSFWHSMRVPAHAALIPLSLASMVAIYLGWTNRRLLYSGLSAGVTAMLSALAIATEVMLGTNTTDFVPTDQSTALPNLVAILVISITGSLVGLFLACLSDLIRSWITSRNLHRLSWLVAASIAFSLTMFWFSSRSGVSDAHANRVRPGMSQPQVEAVLGPPNPLPTQRPESFWDAYTHLGRRYVSVLVVYDTEGNVIRVDNGGFWTTRGWLYW